MDTTTAVEAAKAVDGGLLAAAQNPDLIDVAALVKSARASGTAIDGPGGLLAQITKQIVERTLEVEMTEHLGYMRRATRPGAGPAIPATARRRRL